MNAIYILTEYPSLLNIEHLLIGQIKKKCFECGGRFAWAGCIIQYGSRCACAALHTRQCVTLIEGLL